MSSQIIVANILPKIDPAVVPLVNRARQVITQRSFDDKERAAALTQFERDIDAATGDLESQEIVASAYIAIFGRGC